jgi:hypothetical protein
MERLVLGSARYFTRTPIVLNDHPRSRDTPDLWTVPRSRLNLAPAVKRVTIRGSYICYQ